MRCFWCDRLFPPRQTGGRGATVFVDRPVGALFTAARTWAIGAVATGILTVGDLKMGVAATRTLGPFASTPTPVGEMLLQARMPVATPATRETPRQQFERAMARAIAIRRRG
jgi:hypothetical protein